MMRHSVDELVSIVCNYYPPGLLSNDPLYEDSEEYRRLVAARRRAGANNEAWRSMLKRLGDGFPDNLFHNFSLHLPTGNWDACYKGAIFLSHGSGRRHSVGFLVSFLVPFYVVYSARSVKDLERIEKMKARSAEPARTISLSLPDFPDTMFILPAGVVKPEFIEADPPMGVETRNEISFDLSPDEQPYASRIAQDIEATWQGYERMPPEVGKVIVPDVSTNARKLGDATLYDCLFTDTW